jgi:hypothetical protein
MKTQDHDLPPTIGLGTDAGGDRRVTFPVDGGIYGVGRLAKRLNALVGKDGIAVWRLAGWTDWKHRAIRIDFDSPRDARRAAEECRDDATGAGGRGAGERPGAAPPADGYRRRIEAWDDEGGAQRTGDLP